MPTVTLKRFEVPDEVRRFLRGRLDLVAVGGLMIGRATTAFDDGRAWELTPGTLFHVPPEPHDLWVVGGEPYVSLHFLGEGYYAK